MTGQKANQNMRNAFCRYWIRWNTTSLMGTRWYVYYSLIFYHSSFERQHQHLFRFCFAFQCPPLARWSAPTPWVCFFCPGFWFGIGFGWYGRRSEALALFAFAFHFQFVENCLSERPQEKVERSKQRDAVWAKFLWPPCVQEELRKFSKENSFSKRKGQKRISRSASGENVHEIVRKNVRLTERNGGGGKSVRGDKCKCNKPKGVRMYVGLCKQFRRFPGEVRRRWR